MPPGTARTPSLGPRRGLPGSGLEIVIPVLDVAPVDQLVLQLVLVEVGEVVEGVIAELDVVAVLRDVAR
ncbi:hypothetical protein ACFVH0_09560 [Streptomyces sp. NPDC127117]|uniref:hypothetical protein n=1 Tax=Streptomyces sp. NPDC127117 TaxID=3345368 RepID=UPI003638AABE